MTLRTVLLSLQALLAAAEPDDPQDAVVAAQYKEAPEIFNKTARHWANVYADGMSICFRIIIPEYVCCVYFVRNLKQKFTTDFHEHIKE